GAVPVGLAEFSADPPVGPAGPAVIRGVGGTDPIDPERADLAAAALVAGDVPAAAFSPRSGRPSSASRSCTAFEDEGIVGADPAPAQEHA
ncbi:hypothetical protein, partial [Actinomadura sp. KC06]|uniref:hypothetical protein n=1 Tax=Actinomadura sp. KC06 TaxID=2530369 RepID=UPI001A9CC83F